MNETLFNTEMLSKRELTAYEAMNEKEKRAFENKWLRIQELREEMLDKVEKTNHRAKLKEAREKEVQRKKETHRKIVNGGILQVYLPEELKQLDADNPNQNTKLKKFLDFVFGTRYVQDKIAEIQSRDDEEQQELYEFN